MIGAFAGRTPLPHLGSNVALTLPTGMIVGPGTACAADLIDTSAGGGVGAGFLAYQETFTTSDGSAPGPDLTWSPVGGFDADLAVYTNAVTPVGPLSGDDTNSVIEAAEAVNGPVSYFVEMTFGNVGYQDLTRAWASAILIDPADATHYFRLDYLYSQDPSLLFGSDPGEVRVIYREPATITYPGGVFVNIGSFAMPYRATAGTVLRAERSGDGIQVLIDGTPTSAPQPASVEPCVLPLAAGTVFRLQIDLVGNNAAAPFGAYTPPISPPTAYGGFPYATSDFSIDSIRYGSPNTG